MYSVTLDEKYKRIEIKLAGILSISDAQKCAEEFREKVLSFKKQKFKVLLDRSKLDFFSQELKDILSEVQAMARTFGMGKIATVVTHPEEIIELRKRAKDEGSFNWKGFFIEIDDAQNFLKL